jgi:hypothetical protein
MVQRVEPKCTGPPAALARSPTNSTGYHGDRHGTRLQGSGSSDGGSSTTAATFLNPLIRCDADHTAVAVMSVRKPPWVTAEARRHST